MKQYKDSEKKWFGGVMGGHVGIEGDSDKVVNFLRKGKLHWVSKKHNRQSFYAIRSVHEFYAILGGNPDSMKKAIVYIPVTRQQKQRFDSLTAAYIKQTPYDYALFGMRCGAATYDIIGQLGILPDYRYSKIDKKIYDPKRLRKRLFKKANENNWKIVRQEGTSRRKWEKD